MNSSSYLYLLTLTQVHNIVDKACKELAMEKMIKDLEVSWKTLEFDHETHKVNKLLFETDANFLLLQRTGSTLLKTSEELIETLEENQVIERNEENLIFCCCRFSFRT